MTDKFRKVVQSESPVFIKKRGLKAYLHTPMKPDNKPPLKKVRFRVRPPGKPGDGFGTLTKR